MFTKFLQGTSKVIESVDNTEALRKSLEELSRKDVLVGIPENKTDRQEPEINNATLALILERGNPISNVPPRPFLMPSIEADMDKITKIQQQVLQAAVNQQDTNLQLNRLGMLAQNIVKNWFTDPRNNWPPNSPVTIAKKGSDMPNIDTGQLRNAITYVVRDNA